MVKSYKKPSFIKVAIFSDVILVLNYHGCKGEAINLIPLYLIDITRKTVKPSHLEKLQIIQNINKLMFQVIFIFSDRILIKQIIISSTPFVLGETDFQKSFEWRTGAWVKIYRFNAFARNMNTINWKHFPTHRGIYKLDKNIQQAFWRKIKPKGV